MNKRITLFLLSWLCVLTAFTQTIDAIIIPPPQTAYIADFFSNPNLFRVIVTNKTAQAIDVKIGGKLILDGTTLGSTDVRTSDVFTLNPGANFFNGEDVFKQFMRGNISTDTSNAILKNAFYSGQWPSGLYEWCIEVNHATTNVVLLPNKCAQRFVTAYQVPVLLNPREEQVLNNPGTVLFRWTPMTPAYKEGIVYYEVRVFDVKTGQTPMQAFQTNYPIIEKKVANITSLVWPTEVPVEGGRYVWTVRPLDAQDRPICFPTQYSEIVLFNIIKGDPNSDALSKLGFDAVFPEPGGSIRLHTNAQDEPLSSKKQPKQNNKSSEWAFSGIFPELQINSEESGQSRGIRRYLTVDRRLRKLVLSRFLSAPPDTISGKGSDDEFLRFRVDLSALGASSTEANNGLRIYLIEKKPDYYTKGALLQAIQRDNALYKSPLLNINAQNSNVELAKILPDSMAGREFAWMIRAEVAGRTYDSEVFTFTYQALHLKRKKQQLKFDCECKDSLCAPPVVADRSGVSTWKIGDTLFLGRYELRLTEWANGSGKGIIDLPYIKVGIKVGLAGIRANKAKQIFDGTATLEDSDFPKDIKEFGTFRLNTETLASLNTHFVRMNNTLQEGLKMPFSFKEHLSALKLNLPFDLIVTGMRFSPEKSSLDLAVSIEHTPGQFVKFMAKNVSMEANGISFKDLKLYLAEDVVVNNLTLKASEDLTKSSYILFDCNGIKSFNLQTTFTFDPKKVQTLADQDLTTVVKFDAEKWDDFLATMSLEPFRLVDLGGVTFESKNWTFDKSKVRNPTAFKLPKQADAPATWQGWFTEGVSVKFNKDRFPSRDKDLEVQVKNMVFDSTGANALIEATNVLPPSSNTEGGWGLSIDTLKMAIAQSRADSMFLAGKIELPFFSQEIPYNSIIQMTTTASNFSLFTTENAAINFWKASLILGEGSNIEIFKNAANKWERRAKLNLEAKLDVKSQVFDEFVEAGLLANIKSTLGVNLLDFELPKIKFNGFKVNYPNLSGKIFSLDSVSHTGNVKLAGQDVQLIDFQVVQDTVTVKGKKHNKGVGLVFKLFKGIDFDFSIWSVPSSTDSSKWSFGKYDLKFGVPKFECVAPTTVTTNKTNPRIPKVGEVVDLAGFSMKIDQLASAAELGVGRIRIPYFGTTVKVNFDDKLSLNAEAKVSGGIAFSQISNALFPNNAITTVANARRVAISQLNENALDQIIADNTPEGIKLPLSLRKSMGGFGRKLPFDVLVTNINFDGASPNMSLAMLVPDRSGKLVRFAVPSLGLSPKGFSLSDLRFQLGQNYQLSPGLFLNGSETTTKTSANFNCDGFVSLDLDGYYQFDPKLFTVLGKTDTAKLSFKAKATNLSNFIAQATVDSMQIVDINKSELRLIKAVFDRSTTQNEPTMRFPERYKGKTDATWSGVYVQEATLKIPSFLPNDGQTLNFFGKNLLVDSTGVTGTLDAANVLKATGGSGFGLQVDTVRLTMLQNKLDSAVLLGALDVPLFSESVKYAGRYKQDSAGISCKLATTNDATLAFFGAKVSLLKGAAIEMEKTGDQWIRRANMDVTAEFKVTMDSLKKYGGTVADLTDVMNKMGLTNLDFEFPKITLKSLKVNHKSLPMGKNYGVEKIEKSGDLKIGGQTVNIRGIDLIESAKALLVNGKSFAKSLGLVFQLNKVVDAELAIWMVPDAKDASKWTFGKFEMSNAIPKFECTPVVATTAPTGAVKPLAVNQDVVVGDFKMKVTKLATGTAAAQLGEGELRIPYMGTTVKMKFDNSFKVNTEGRAFGGIVKSELNTISFFPMGSVKDSAAVGNVIDVAKMKFDKLTSLVSTDIQMPLSLKQRLGRFGNQLPFDLLVTNINLAPTKQSMSLALLVPNPISTGSTLAFATNDLLLNGKGFGLSSLQMDLGSDLKLADGVFLNGGNNNVRTKAIFNCDGMESFSLAGRYEFANTNFVKPLEGTGNAKFEFSGTSSSLSNFIVEATSSPLELSLFGGSELRLSRLSYDRSATTNSPTVKYPPQYGTTVPTSWTGFYAEEASLAIPSLFPNQSGKLKFAGKNILLDSAGVSGTFQIQDLLSIKIEDLWQLKLDTLGVNVLKGKMADIQVAGEIGFPIFGASTRFNGKGVQTILKKDTTYTYALLPRGGLNLNAWRVNFELLNTSKIDLVREQKAGIVINKIDTRLDAELSVDLSTDFIKDNVDPALIDLLKAKLRVNVLEFAFPKFRLSNLKLNPKGIQKITFDSIRAIGDVTLAGMKIDVVSTATEVAEIVTKNGRKQGTAFVMNLRKTGINFKFRVWAVPSSTDSTKWDFGKLDLVLDLPKFSCTNSNVAFTDKSAGTLAVNKKVTVAGGFDMEISQLASGSTPGKGKITVKHFGTTYDVAFGNDLKINSKNEVIEGTVITLPNQDIFPTESIVKAPNGVADLDLSKLRVTKALTAKLENLTSVAKFPISMSSALNKMSEVLELPTLDLPLNITLSGINFTPTGAMLTGFVAVETGGTYLPMGVGGLTIHKDGVTFDKLKLFLVDNL